ncbi:MAG: O-antigen ligase family protein [Parvibaculaceae bacterium]
MSLAETAPYSRRPATALGGLEFWRNRLLWLLMASGWFVVIEPSPYELIFVLALVLFLPGGLRVPLVSAPLILFLVLYNVGGALGLIGIIGDKDATWFIIISFYMAATALFFCFCITADPVRRMDAIRSGFIIAGVLGSITGIIGYFGFFGMHEAWAPISRAQGTFKDPNVLATFLIPPFIFLAQDLLLGHAKRPVFSLGALLIITIGLFLAFSRGAWINTGAAMIMLISMSLLLAPSNRLRNRVIFGSIGGAILLVVLIAVVMSIPQVQRIFEIRASFSQSYDVGETGRFGNQVNSIPYILTLPYGMYPRHFHTVFGEDPHNVYLNAFASYGWLGGFSFVTLVITTVWVGWRACLPRTAWQHHAIAVFCPLVTTMAQGIQIDIDHWRHFYLLLGCMWGLFAVTLAQQRAQAEKIGPRIGDARASGDLH